MIPRTTRELRRQQRIAKDKARLAHQPELPGDWDCTRPEICPECFGKGRVKNEKGPCGRCGGKGAIPKAPEVGRDVLQGEGEIG